jgi:anaerobic magnesium-protoporphyrin IX monomethyl ester cyclase
VATVSAPSSQTAPARDLSGLKITLVFPSFRRYRETGALVENADYLGSMPPLILTYVAAILERHGCRVQIVDANVENLSPEEGADRAAPFAPDFVGFTLTHLDFPNSLEWIRCFSRRIRAPILVGGPLTRYHGDVVLKHPEIAFSVIGDGDDTLPELLRRLSDGGDVRAVPGIAYRESDGTVRRTVPRAPLADVDSRPFPARHLLNNDLYFSILSQRRRFTAGMTVFGCPYPCAYCSMSRTPRQIRSAKSIVDEMELCQKEFGIHEIDFPDPNICLNKDRMLEMCDLIRKRRLDVSWSGRANITTLSEDVLRAMASAGCAWLGYGIESGDAGILSTVKKPQGGLERVRETVRLTQRAGIRVCGFFILGLPGETKETANRTAEFILKTPFDYVQIASYWLIPNTSLYEEAKRESGMDFWAKTITEGLDPKPYLLYKSELGLDEIKYLVHRTYARFYTRPGYVVRAVARIRSWHEVRKASRAFFGIILGIVMKFLKRTWRREPVPFCHGTGV